ncbi:MULTISPECIES: hypothetical protein [Amycolatopsis]|uniref:hypothetical protein n=1 Tax=Amycolatopsis sp. KNN50.9b TaxID=2018303 RepID=UPI000B8B1508|nr:MULTISPECIES: hypothetical protein [Amycolatopsis]OXM71930.1 hypothetical protein CF166_17680 [Amycolatopsis sp. KNN50.9b]
MTTDLNTLVTALQVEIDDHLGKPARVGRPSRLSDAELLTLADKSYASREPDTYLTTRGGTTPRPANPPPEP